MGDKNYMKRIFAYTDGKNEPYGVRKYLGDRYTIANHSAANTLTSNEVALISSGSNEIIVSVLSTTRDKDSGDISEKRQKAINEIMEYISKNQFE